MANNAIKVRARWGYTGSWADEFATCTWRLGVFPWDQSLFDGVISLPETSSDASQALSGSDSRWTWAVNWAADWPGADDDQVYGEELQLATANVIWSFWNSIRGQYPSSTRLESVAIVLSNTSGDSEYSASNFTLKSPLGGINPTNSSRMPPNVSEVLSMRSAVAGKRGRGRVFLPAAMVPTSSLNTDGFIPESFREDVGDAANVLMDSFNLLDAVNENAIFPVTIASDSSTTGVIATQYGMGRKFDTQRRRTNQVPELTEYIDVLWT